MNYQEVQDALAAIVGTPAKDTKMRLKVGRDEVEVTAVSLSQEEGGQHVVVLTGKPRQNTRGGRS